MNILAGCDIYHLTAKLYTNNSFLWRNYDTKTRFQLSFNRGHNQSYIFLQKFEKAFQNHFGPLALTFGDFINIVCH